MSSRPPSDVPAPTTRREADEAALRLAVDHQFDVFTIHSAIRDEHGRIVDFRYDFVNRAFEQWTGIPAADAIGRTLLDLFPGSGFEGLFADLSTVVESGEPLTIEARETELELRGERTHVAVEVHVAKHGDGCVTTVRDVTPRHQALRRERLVSRLYATLTRVNKAVVQSDSREALYDAVCRAAVAEGGAALAWIGEPDASGTVRVRAAAGEETGYLDAVSISARDVPRGRGPTGIAVREGVHALAPDISTDPMMRPWRRLAAEHGLRSSAAFPLRCRGRVVGAITLYSKVLRFFDSAEIGLLDQLAHDVSYALDALETEAERQAAERRLRLQARLLDEVTAAIVAVDDDGHITSWNLGAEAMFGWSRADALARDIGDVVTPVDPVAGQATKTAVLAEGRWEGSLDFRRRDGSTFPAYLQASLLREGDGTAGGRVVVLMDVAERVAIQRELDGARRFLEAVTESMGEALIAADPSRRIIYANAAAARLLGHTHDELMELDLHRDVFGCVDDVPCALCDLGEGTSAGRLDDVSLLRADGGLLPVALTASSMRFRDEDCWVLVFSDDTQRRAENEALRRELEARDRVRMIRDALQGDALVLHAQPIVDAATREVRRHELLVRVRADDGTIVPPAEFLPVAERHGLITEIDRWVVGRAVALAEEGHAVQVNLSAASIGDRETGDWIVRRVERSSADPGLLVFEVTETALLHQADAARRFAERLATLGCRLALDDFGTGYGGFVYLKQFHVDQLKIDVEFVRDLRHDPASAHVVRAIVALAAGFGLETVAEGVEDEATLAEVTAMGVDLVQGYLTGRPVPLEAAVAPGAAR